MAVSDTALGHASAMGERAGIAWRDTGVPTPNPFDQAREHELAQAWRTAYLTVAKPSGA